MSDKNVRMADMAGKTVAAVFEEYCDLLIVFTDGTHSLLRATCNYNCDYNHDGEPKLVNGRFALADWDKQLPALLSLGVITQAEYVSYLADVARGKKMAELSRRADYERLKKEFEGK